MRSLSLPAVRVDLLVLVSQLLGLLREHLPLLSLHLLPLVAQDHADGSGVKKRRHNEDIMM